MDRTNENIKKYYESKSLSDDKIALLTGKGPDKMFGIYAKVAAAAAVILILSFAVRTFYDESLEDRVVKEIAMNHNKELRVEYLTDNLGQLQTQLDKLDFPLIGVQELISQNYELIGGRYCSIQGNLAAQLKIKNSENNNIETLYVTTLNDDLENINPVSINDNGTQIKIWKKDGILYGVASGR